MKSGPTSALTCVRSPMLYLVGLRVLMGVVFLLTAVENAQKGLYGPGFRQFVAGWANGNPIGWYRDFLETVVLPHWQIAATIQSVVEPALGIMLIIGLLTPFTALGGAFFFINLLLASWGREWPWTYINMIAILVVVAASGSGRCIGVDNLLGRVTPFLDRLLRGVSTFDEAEKENALDP